MVVMFGILCMYSVLVVGILYFVKIVGYEKHDFL